MSEKREPRGKMSIRTLAMPADTNPAGDIFGGWVLSQMDIAGGIATRKHSKKRVVTISVDSMRFHLPVFVGDTLCCYTDIVKTGRTSMAVHIEAWASRDSLDDRVLVTEGLFTYVSIDENRRPLPIKD